MQRRREDMDDGVAISGGRFVEPAANRLLPNVREYRLQGGRFVPAAEQLLPPVRQETIQMDWSNAYHFGSAVSGMGRREDE